METLLFEKLELRAVTLQNRIVVPPMTQYSAMDGVAGDWHLVHLGQFAMGGAGMVFTESTYVEASARNNPSCLSLFSNEQAKALGRIADFITTHSHSKLCVQLCHAGRKAASRELWRGGEPMTADEGAYERIAPSPILIKEGWPVPRKMTVQDIQLTIENFVDAVKRANSAGADAIELHGAHGYLVHQFLSPISNTRADKYGGSLENRLRFGLELFEAMRAAWPEEKPLGIRVSATDWVPNGWTVEDTIVFSKELEKLGCDFIDVSSGGISPDQQITPGPGYQSGLAKSIRDEVSMKVIAVGEIVNANQAETLLRLEHADLVAVGRRSMYDPRWTWHAAEELGVDLIYPKQYERAHPKIRRQKHP